MGGRGWVAEADDIPAGTAAAQIKLATLRNATALYTLYCAVMPGVTGLQDCTLLYRPWPWGGCASLGAIAASCFRLCQIYTQCTAGQYRTVQYSTVQYSTVQYSRHCWVHLEHVHGGGVSIVSIASLRHIWLHCRRRSLSRNKTKRGSLFACGPLTQPSLGRPRAPGSLSAHFPFPMTRTDVEHLQSSPASRLTATPRSTFSLPASNSALPPSAEPQRLSQPLGRASARRLAIAWPNMTHTL